MSAAPSDVNDSLALDTGGRRLAQSNDYSKGLRAVMADASAYYLLGYAPTAAAVADGKFHEIDVKVRRKGVRVLARKGYWAPTPEEMRPRTPMPTAPADVTTALGRLAPLAGQRGSMDWWLGFERGASGATRATFTWEPLGSARRRRARAPSASRVDRSATHRTPTRTGSRRAAGRGGARPVAGAFHAPPGRAASCACAPSRADGALVDEWSEDVVVPGSRRRRAGHRHAARLPRVDGRRPGARSSTGPGEIAPIASRATAPHRSRAGDDSAVGRRNGRRAERRAADHAGQAPGRAAGVTRAAGEGLPRVELPVANLAQAEYVLRVAAGKSSGTQALAFSVVP